MHMMHSVSCRNGHTVDADFHPESDELSKKRAKPPHTEKRAHTKGSTKNTQHGDPPRIPRGWKTHTTKAKQQDYDDGRGFVVL